MHWNTIIFGPAETPFEDGTFRLVLTFDESYPNKPPTAKFLSRMFHPNVDENGYLCLDILQNRWSPTLDVVTILISVQSLLDDPGLNNPVNAEAARLYGENMKEYAQRVRETVEKSWLDLQHTNEEEQMNTTTAGVPVPERAGVLVASIPTAPTCIDGSSSTPRITDTPPMLRGVEFSPDALIESLTSTPPSSTLSISTISDLTPTELDTEGMEPMLTRHSQFYLDDGNVEIVCGHTVFRTHSSILSLSSSKLGDILSPSILLNAPTPEGCPRIVSDDSAEDFAVLLKMVTTPGFPAWHRVPEFTVFASLLRMATKYGYCDVRGYLLHLLKDAYPTKWEVYQIASVLGEDVFGSPKPHPNEVLKLFFDQNVRFALPVAAYRAGLGGFSSLINNDPGLALPRLALTSTLHGMDVIRSEVSRRAQSIVRDMSLKGCGDWRCVANNDVNALEQRTEGLDDIYDVMVKGDGGDVLSPLSLGGHVVCADCAKAAENRYYHLRATIWEVLPRSFKVGNSWEEI